MISQSKQKGFTIVELLIVIVVIGILAAISIVAYNNVTQKARDDERVSDARNIVNALASYNSEKGEWLTAANASASLGTYETVKIPSKALNKLGNAAPTSGTPNVYQISACPTTGTQTGVKVTYFKEAEPALTPLPSVTAGTGC